MILQEIERRLGGRIPIQDFFDLIVGTRLVVPWMNLGIDTKDMACISTGGIIALGLGVQNWSVQDCINRFRNLCHEAFSERVFYGVPILEQLATAVWKSKYETAPFENLLKNAFGTDLLFGGLSQPHHYARKVAVTTTGGVGWEPRILTNYNRPVGENRKFGTIDYIQR